MSWQTPKTDWQASDSYNFYDINRVESNTRFVYQYLQSFGYETPSATFKTTRTSSSYDLISDINNLENNMVQLWRSFIYDQPITATTWTPSKPLNAAVANRWEQTISNMYEHAQNTVRGLRYAGTFACGQEGLLP